MRQPDEVPDAFDPQGKAVLFAFGWGECWGRSTITPPHISEAVIDRLIELNVTLAGVDTMNVDDANDVVIIGNLTNVERLIGERFQLFAVSLKANGVAAMGVRTFAELE